MALLYENNGDWPDSDEDYNKLFEDEAGTECFFCNKRDCICDEVYDFAKESELMDELGDE